MKLIHTPDGQSIVKLDDIDFEVPDILMIRPAIVKYIEEAREERYYHDRAEKWEQVLKVLDQIVDDETKTVWKFVKSSEPPAAQKEPDAEPPADASTKPCCPYCHSTNVVSWGSRHNTLGENKVHKCKDCNRNFSEKNHQKVNFEKVKRLHAEGLKPREIADITRIKLATVYFHLRKLKGTETADAQASEPKPSNQFVGNTFLQNLDIVKEGTPAKVNESPLDTLEIASAPQQEMPKDEPIADKKPELKMFIEDSGFDYRAHRPTLVGSSEVYDSGTGKLVIRSTRFGDGIVLTTKEAIDRLLSYEEKDFERCIKSIRQAKRRVLWEYVENLRKSRLPLWSKDATGAEVA